MVRLPEWIDSYLTYNRKQRNGIIVVVLLIGITICINIYLRMIRLVGTQEELLVFGPAMIQFNARMDSISADSSWRSDFGDRPDGKSIWADAERFPFDPNTLDSAGWVRLGFSPKQSASIVRYRSKGAVFRKPEDLLRLYMMDTAKFLDLLPFVTIAPLPAQPAFSDFVRSERPAPVQVELNRADTLELTALKGIGPAFARRIVKYRERLGGFRSMDQLYEVYGMDSARIAGFAAQVTLDTAGLSYININTADFKTLIRLPYFNKNQVNAILNYRDRHGPFKALSDLQRIHVISQETFDKAVPHLNIGSPN